jgi:hypothetical protein
MPPHRASSADPSSPPQTPAQTAVQIAASIEQFLADHTEAAVLEDGKVLFDLRSAKLSLSTEYDRCTLHLWSEEKNLVRQVVAAIPRAGSLRLSTQRFGQPQGKLLELVASRERRSPTTRETSRQRYAQLLERVLTRCFPDWTCDGFRTSMDLERSFGPGYARGSLVRGNHAWAVIGANENESAPTIDGILTLGILWLHHCREKGGGRRLYQGLKLILPRGTAMLTLSRLPWLNQDAAQWELWELDQSSEELLQRDAADQGNLRTRLVHHPDQQAAKERFATAAQQILQLVPAADHPRVEQRLRSSSELAFLLHGMEFARARTTFAPNSFTPFIEITAGTGPAETQLTGGSRPAIAASIAELFARRRAIDPSIPSVHRNATSSRGIGVPLTTPAHARMQLRSRPTAGSHARDPLYRAAPERWLESMLRQDLAPLTRNLAPSELPSDDRSGSRSRSQLPPHFANEPHPDSIGNRADAPQPPMRDTDGNRSHNPGHLASRPLESRVIPRLDPQHVYAQVPAIAGASDRGLLDLLGVTADGRLAVIELKVEDDLHFALQGLDYWIRVRHHHLQPPDPTTGLGDLQRHGYFTGIELSPLQPRLYLVAPSLHIHPATETILRYLSPRVEWNLLALDERWRQRIRVVWRKHSGL